MQYKTISLFILALAIYLRFGWIAVVPLFILYVSSTTDPSANLQLEDEQIARKPHPGKRRRASVQSETMARRPLTESVTQNTIQGVVFLPHISQEKLDEMQQFLMTKMKVFPRLRSRLSFSDNGAEFHFEEVDYIDPNYHFHTISCQTEQEALEYIDKNIVPKDFDNDKPLWAWYFFPLADNSETSITCFSIHHCLTDGYSMNRIMTEILSDETGMPLQIIQPRPSAKKQSMLEQFAWMIAGIIPRLKAQLKIYGLVMFGDSPTVLKDAYPYQYHPGRKTVYFPRVPLDKLAELRHRIKEQTGVKTTLTDLYISLVAGAWTRYMTNHKDPLVDGYPKVRAWCPYMFYRDDTFGLHNLWAFVSTRLPVGNKWNSITRLIQTKIEFDSVKYPPVEPLAQLDISGQILMVAKTVGRFFMTWVVKNAVSNHSLIFTSVPTVAKQGYICGIPVLDCRCTMPLLVPFAALLSYNGCTSFTFTVDPERINGKEFATCLEAELTSLAEKVKMDTNWIPQGSF